MMPAPPTPVRPTSVLRLILLVVLVVVLGGTAVALAYSPVHNAHADGAAVTSTPTAPAPQPEVVAATSALAARPAAAAPPPTPELVSKRITALTQAPDLGGRLLARVIDVATGAVLFDKQGDTAGTPASVTKLLTAAAILSVYPPSHRFTTTAVAGTDGAVVLVGGGDPTLTAAAPGEAPAYSDAGRLSDLAKQIAAKGITPTQIVVDTSLYSGPSINPLWDPSDIGTSYGAPITPLMVDGGRTGPQDTARSGQPDIAAGMALAKLLGTPGLPVVEGTAPKGAKLLGSVQSAPLADDRRTDAGRVGQRPRRCSVT